jgi:signal recognition particle subunit SRP54
MDGLGQNMGMMGKIPGLKNVAMAKQMRKQMAQGGGMPGMGGFPGMPGMGLPGMPGMGFPGMGFPGMGMPGGQGQGESLTKMRTLSTAEKNARKAARKREKDARKKSRR